MSEPLKATNQRWSQIDGRPVLVYQAKTVDGHLVEIAVPLQMIVVASGEARVRLDAAKHAGEPAVMPPPWHPAKFIPIQTMDVGIVESTGEKRVGLILDRTLSTELALSFSLSDASRLGQQMQDEVAKAGREPRQDRPH